MTDAKLATILNLKKLAEHPDTPEKERLLATEKMTALMEKYAITELMLRDDHGTSDKIVRHDYSYNGVYSRALRDACCRMRYRSLHRTVASSTCHR